ncbi:hypothetical protein CC86DRAFT_15368 [Ophiobolus disseminans]|uniref:Uncharacterized protein n=1 Tax=Ophiobolus disseminans TaxID=1469910 RepID=A0A6A7AMY9_9PLEO|nr:hypothetical protein CC86DRAFT_15368 [Ophiobolus disseminans]
MSIQPGHFGALAVATSGDANGISARVSVRRCAGRVEACISDTGTTTLSPHLAVLSVSKASRLAPASGNASSAPLAASDMWWTLECRLHCVCESHHEGRSSKYRFFRFPHVCPCLLLPIALSTAYATIEIEVAAVVVVCIRRGSCPRSSRTSVRWLWRTRSNARELQVVVPMRVSCSEAFLRLFETRWGWWLWCFEEKAVQPKAQLHLRAPHHDTEQ